MATVNRIKSAELQNSFLSSLPPTNFILQGLGGCSQLEIMQIYGPLWTNHRIAYSKHLYSLLPKKV